MPFVLVIAFNFLSLGTNGNETACPQLPAAPTVGILGSQSHRVQGRQVPVNRLQTRVGRVAAFRLMVLVTIAGGFYVKKGEPWGDWSQVDSSALLVTEAFTSQRQKMEGWQREGNE